MSFRLLLTTTALLLLGSACHQGTSPTATADCIDASKIRKDAMCTMEYAPVCGCDQKTYSNACQATNAGVRTYTTGACPGAK